jgi:CRISPR system Cascade subunit CasB
MTVSSTEQPVRSRRGRVGAVVDARAGDLQRRLLAKRDPTAVAALARLRRGAGKSPGELLDILEFTVADEFFVGRPDAEATVDENAAHVALTLFAMHQQSRGEPMHRRGQGLGAALRALHQGDPGSVPEPVRRRFRVLGTADSFAELSYHLRGAVQLLRGAGVGLDYGLLADQLVGWQWPGGPERIRLRWGREFYRTERSSEPPSDTPPASS